ncbi:hypothetical protein, partial [Herbaspirillum camelliae]|uniref:hypothetical protein n=1 Tax=Herbaspirillum camelliae TaxID=1892903 RepID=UPI001E4B7BC8
MNTVAMMQTWTDGTHDVLPVAAYADHARMPVMWRRQTDRVMRPDDSPAVVFYGRGPIRPSVSAEECTAHPRS